MASICASVAVAQRRDFREIVTSAGYDWEEYTVTTDDEYILKAFRITGKTGEAVSGEWKPPVLLMHGMFGEAESFVKNTVVTPPAFLMVDEGYDVWLGNNRGNRHSPGHRRLSQQDEAYWDFSVAEFGQYDLPAFINLVKSTTPTDKVILGGYSQGSTQIMYGLSKYEDSFYADNVSAFLAFAPCSKITNT